MQTLGRTNLDDKAFIITGPTSGIGLATAFEMAAHGTLILVGRDGEKLQKLQRDLEQKGGRAVSVVCDLSDLASVRRAVAEIVALDLPVVDLHNNAGISPLRPGKNTQG